MNNSDQDFISDEDNNYNDTDYDTDNDSVDIMSTDCGDDKDNSSETLTSCNKFSIENILGLTSKFKKKVGSKEDTDDKCVESEKKIRCVKPTPISAATRSAGILLFYQYTS